MSTVGADTPAVLHSFSGQLGASHPGLWSLLEVGHPEYWEAGVDVTHHAPEERTRNPFIQRLQYLTKLLKYNLMIGSKVA